MLPIVAVLSIKRLFIKAAALLCPRYFRPYTLNILLYIFPSKPSPINYLDIFYSNSIGDMILKVDEKTESVDYPGNLKNLLDNKDCGLKEFSKFSPAGLYN